MRSVQGEIFGRTLTCSFSRSYARRKPLSLAVSWSTPDIAGLLESVLCGSSDLELCWEEEARGTNGIHEGTFLEFNYYDRYVHNCQRR